MSTDRSWERSRSNFEWPSCGRDNSGIFHVLDDLLLKAQEELDDTRLAVLNAAHNFPKMEQSFEDPLGQATSNGEPHR